MSGSSKVLLVVSNIPELNIDLKYGEPEKMKSKIRILKQMSVFLLITIFYCVKKIDFKENIRLLDFLDSIAHMQVSDFLL